MIRTEKFNGVRIRYFEFDGEWYASLSDVCKALCLDLDTIQEILPKEYLCEIGIPMSNNYILCIKEQGIYELISYSEVEEARKFNSWQRNMMSKLRQKVGLKSYEIFRMTEPDIQDQIDSILDAIYWDEEKKCLMYSVTVQGGDVEQIPFEEA